MVGRTRVLNIWHHMKKRCFDTKNDEYKNYGQRGISICNAWYSFEKFYEWAMENGYSDNLTLDRIDNNKNYSPENCRWSTYKQQANNKRNNAIVVIEGYRKTREEWAEFFGISAECIKYRQDKGIEGWELVKKPAQRSKKRNLKTLSINGQEKTYKEWAVITGIPETTIRTREFRGYKDDDLIAPIGTLRRSV